MLYDGSVMKGEDIKSDFDVIKRNKERYFFPSLPLRFPPEIINGLVRSTMLEPNQEKLVLLVGSEQGIVTSVIPVGFSAEGRNLSTPDFTEQVSRVCSDAKSQGLSVIADYHVHTQRTVESYVNKGFRPEDSTILSAADIDKVYFDMQLSLQGKHWSRAVGVVHDKKVFINAFNVLRPIKFKSYMDVFELQDSSTQSRQRGVIGRVRTYISDPKYLIEHLYVRPREIIIDGSTNLPVTFNTMNSFI